MRWEADPASSGAISSLQHTMLSLDLPLTDATKFFQSEYISKHLERTRGNMSEAAAKLGMHRSNLYRKMRQLGLDTDDEE